MMERKEDMLESLLERLGKGEPLEKVIQETPEFSEILSVGKLLFASPPPTPSPEKFALTLVKVGEELGRMKRKSPFFTRWERVLAYSFASLLFLWGVFNLSAQSLPGTPLYPLKLVTEKIKFLLTPTSEGRIELKLIFLERRTQEALREAERRGTLTPGFLKSILEESLRLLEETEGLPPPTRELYTSRMYHLTQYQRGVFQRLQNMVPPAQRGEVEEAIRGCERNMQRMGEMMRKMRSRHRPGMPHRPW